MSPRLLVVAKAPEPGRVKTRLGASVGMAAAADIAAAALLDTLAAGAQAFPGRCHLALAGDLDAAHRGDEIAAALTGWTVFAQEGESFAERLAHAHRTVGGTGDPVVQIGMDTPQVTPQLLRDAAECLEVSGAVLGPAEDGGWWLLALEDAGRADLLRSVPMSTPDTYADTLHALMADGAAPATHRTLRDVDTRADAEVVAAAAPGTLFAQAWRRAAPDPAVAS